MNESTFNDLKADIAAYGLREPIWLYEGQILDGRNRHRACRELALAGPTRDYQGNDPLGFILSMNLHRRHLDESQRAMVAAKIANMRQGERTDLQPSENSPKVSQAKAAEMLNISDFSLKAAKKVYAEAQPEVIRAVETGTMAVSAAAKLAEQPVAVQRTVVKALESGSAKTVRVALQHATTAHNGQAPTPATPPLTADEDAFDKRLTHTHEYFAKVAKSDIVERLGEKFTEGDIQHWTQRLVQLRETTTDLATRMWKAFRGEGGEP
jgi:hypothetical protein